MENFREKMRRENFLEGVWLRGGAKKNVVGFECSLQAHQNVFSPNWRENWERESDLLYGQKCSQLLSWATLAFNFFIFCFPGTLCPFLPFFFFFFLMAWGDSDLFSFCSFFFSCLTRRDFFFFFWHDFYF